MDSYETNERFRELCYVGDLELVKKYFDQSTPDVNSQNKINGWTALHWAARKNNIPIVKFLIEKGADINITNQKGQKPGEQARDAELKQLLGVDDSTSETIESKPSFVPNFIKNPDFHYAQSYLYTSTPSSQSNQENSVNLETRTPGQTQSRSEFITIRIKSHLDEDFVEFDFDKNNTDFDAFKKLCSEELEEKNCPIIKIRKLPNILVRNTNDIKRLKNEQEIEILFAQ